MAVRQEVQIVVPPRAPSASALDALAVYLKPRVLTVMFLGFSGGLPFALTLSTMQAWLTQSGIDIRAIGLFSAIGIPYVVKFLWAPFVDALDVPILSLLLGRRRGWLLISQLALMAAIVLMAFCSPALSLIAFALAAILVATASATQDIVIDAFRVESLPENEQAAGMASYVAAYRVGALVSGAGTLYLVTGGEKLGFTTQAAWTASYVVMALLVSVGIGATLLATEPAKSTAAAAEHSAHAAESSLRRVLATTTSAFMDFFSRDLAVSVLAFVVLFKLADALATALNTKFILDMGFSRDELATINKGVGFIATLSGGFAGGFVARALPLGRSLLIGGILQTITILAFSLQAIVGRDLVMLTFSISIEAFTAAIGTVIFVAYLSALCRSPLHTATQFALLTALAALGRTVFALGAGYLAAAGGWPMYFVICALTAIPSFVLLFMLMRRGHFAALGVARVPSPSS
jgi:MFS transporter, PAT family, beta-lactamase induction signal transducer AmpG